MPILTSEQLKDKFSDKQRPGGSDFADLIDTCINAGYTGNVTIGNSIFEISNGIILNISIADENTPGTITTDNGGSGSTNEESSENTDSTSCTDTSILLTSGTGYDGVYTHENKVFPDPDVLKVYVNDITRNRFVAYQGSDGKIYWELVKRGWFGTVDSLKSNPGLSSGLKSKPFNVFVDLTTLKGSWQEFFSSDTTIVSSIKNVWTIS